MNKDLLIIFTRNPELGKVKTRLSSTVGNEPALRIYEFLLKHTAAITKELKVVKEVYYSENIKKNDLWDTDLYTKKLQIGSDLGERMHHAFQKGFNEGYTRIIIIGSDMYELSKGGLESAFRSLKDHDYVIGPAKDGGYYLLGMKRFNSDLFKNKNWGKDTVLQATLNDLKKESLKLLPVRNDVDYFEDIQHIDIFQQFL